VHDDPAMGSPPPVTDRLRDPAASSSPDPVRPGAIGEDRSPNAWVCPFLRAIDDTDALGLPIEAPDPANRCAALTDAVPQSLRQQELVCLTSGHVNCPRYLRGSLGSSAPGDRVAATRNLTRSILAALALFGLAFAASITFVLANGGLVLTAAGAPTIPTSSPAADVPAASQTALPAATAATPSPTTDPTATPSPSPIATPSPTATASPSVAPSPTPEPTPSPTPTPTPSRKTPSGATASRLALLKPCPDTANCYIYIVRAGDNLSSIANYFGVPLSSVKAMNPWTNSGLKAGRELRIPPPTR